MDNVSSCDVQYLFPSSQLVPCYRSFVINSIPNLLCFDDEIIASKERGVAKGVVKLYEEKAGIS